VRRYCKRRETEGAKRDEPPFPRHETLLAHEFRLVVLLSLALGMDRPRPGPGYTTVGSAHAGGIRAAFPTNDGAEAPGEQFRPVEPDQALPGIPAKQGHGKPYTRRRNSRSDRVAARSSLSG